MIGKNLQHDKYRPKPNYRSSIPSQKVTRKVDSLRGNGLEDDLVIHVTAKSIFDNRTDGLVHQTSRIMRDHWWLNDMCDCDSPLYDFFAAYFLQLGR